MDDATAKNVAREAFTSGWDRGFEIEFTAGPHLDRDEAFEEFWRDMVNLARHRHTTVVEQLAQLGAAISR